jgi:hypothetical protein
VRFTSLSFVSATERAVRFDWRVPDLRRELGVTGPRKASLSYIALCVAIDVFRETRLRQVGSSPMKVTRQVSSAPPSPEWDAHRVGGSRQGDAINPEAEMYP